jgi:hypothetical protein
MENKELEELIKGLINRAGNISLLYLSGAGVALLVATLKFQGDKKEFEFKRISFKLTQYWIVAIAFTLVHIYFSLLFVNACHKFLPLDNSCKKIAFNSLTYSEAPFIFQDLKLVIPTSVRHEYKLDLTSPAAILLLGILVLLVITIIKVEKTTWRQKLFYWFMAYFILVTNFFTGGWWMIELSKSLSTAS